MAEILEQIAEVLQCPIGNVERRIAGLKIGPVCSRCGGCGSYSFNQIDGSRCYGCGGRGHMNPKAKDLPGVLEEAKAAVADGRLERYLDGLRASRVAKAGSDRIFAAWRQSNAAQLLKGWASHVYGYDDSPPERRVPGNFAEVRDANGKMAGAFDVARKAIDAWRYPPKGADVDRQALALAAEAAIERAIEVIAESDVIPSPELVAWVQAKQRAAVAQIQAKGAKPGFAVYGE